MEEKYGKAFRNRMRAIHPGEIIKEEYLAPLNVSVNQLGLAMQVTSARVYEITSGRRGISANTALRLAIALGTTPEFWMNLQSAYDIRSQEISVGELIAKEASYIYKDNQDEDYF